MRGRSRHAKPGDMASPFARQSATVADWRGSRACWVVALVTTIAAGCGGGGQKEAAPTTTAGSATTTVDPKKQVTAAYQNYWQQYSRVTSDPNGRPDDPVLGSTVTAQFAKQMQLNVTGLREQHRYTKGDVMVHPQQVDIQGSNATLMSCNRD